MEMLKRIPREMPCVLMAAQGALMANGTLEGLNAAAGGMFWNAVSQQSNGNMIHHVSKIEEENRVAISTEAERSVDTSQNLFLIKSAYKLEIEGNCVNLKKPYMNTHN